MLTLPHKILVPNRPDPQNAIRLDRAALPMIVSMEQNGMRVDKGHMIRLHKQLTDEMADLQAQVVKLVGREINIGSGDQLAQLLFQDLKLKQAGKEKWTKSKARLAADSDVLRGMISQHPCIPILLQWKVREKLRSTYTHSLIAQADEHDRIHPDINHTGPETGRLSCSNPNLQNCPIRTQLGREIRNGFIPSKGNVLGTVDACLHPDTLVKTVWGDKRIRDIKVGEKVLTWRGRKIAYGTVSRRSQIHPKKAYRLTFDSGQSVIASYDHRWPTLTYPAPGRKAGVVIKTTEELKINERMVPCREGRSGNGRKTWYSWSAFEYEHQHILVAEAVHGPRPEGHDVHHVDEDYNNNHPNNLEYKEAGKHKSDHAKENYKRQDHEYRIERLREGLKTRRSYHGVNNPNSKLTDDQKSEIQQGILENSWTARYISDTYGLSYGYSRALVVRTLKGKNHRLVKIEPVGIQPMWAITVESDHNYVLACGVVTMNSQIEMRTMAHDAMCRGMLEIFWTWQDLYWGVAEDMYRRKFDEKERKEGIEPVSGQSFKNYYRFNAKTTALGVTYAISPAGLVDLFLTAEPPAIPFLTGGEKEWDYDRHYKKAVKVCEDAIRDFFVAYREILDRRREHHRRARKYGFVWDMWGRIRWIPQVRSTHQWIVEEGLRAAGNLAGQGGAAGVIKLWMAVLWDRIEEYWGKRGLRMLIQIHDELVCEGPRKVVEDFLEECKYTLRNMMPGDTITVPLEADSDVGERWGEMK